MKKLTIILFCVLSLLLLAAGCGQSTTFYQCTAVDFTGGVAISTDNTWMSLNKDGSGLLCLDGSKYTINWNDYGNGQFTVTTTAAEGSYVSSGGETHFGTKDGNTLDLIIYGIEYTFQKSSAAAISANEASAAKTAENTDSLSVLTKEEAAERSGIFIKRGDAFYPLAFGSFATGNMQQGDAYPVCCTNDMIPRLNDGDELVLFSPTTVERVSMARADSNGYTVPVGIYFYDDMYDSGFYLYALGNLYDLQMYWPEYYSNEELDAFFDDLSFNDCAADIYGDFTEDETVFIEENDNWATALLDCEEGSTVTIEYYVGSAYHEIELPACLEYWNFPSENRFGLDTERTTEGYYLLDVSGLERGTYGIHVSNSYDNSYYWNSEFDLFYSNAFLFSIG